MRPATDEKIRLDNFRAQYNSILSSIKEVNIELESLIQKKSQILEDLKNISSELEERRAGINTIIKREFKIKERELYLEIIQEDIDKQNILLSNKKALVEKELRAERHQLNSERATIKKDVDNLLIQKQEIKEVIAVLEKQYKLLSANIRETIASRNDLVDQIIAAKKRILELAQEYKRETEKGVCELNEVRRQVEEERNKVRSPVENLKKRELIIRRKERDLEVYIGRMRKKYKELYPNLEFRI